MRIYLVSIMFSVLAFLPKAAIAQGAFFTQANCIVVYSLRDSADKYFNDEIIQLAKQIAHKNIRFIDLNNWRNASPHLDVSGRFRNLLRQRYALPKRVNQAVVIDQNGKLISRYSGSVTLVNAMIDCHK